MLCFTRTLNLGILKFFRSIKKFSLTFFSEGEIYSYEDFVVVVQAIAGREQEGERRTVFVAKCNPKSIQIFFRPMQSQDILHFISFISKFQKVDLSLEIAEEVGLQGFSPKKNGTVTHQKTVILSTFLCHRVFFPYYYFKYIYIYEDAFCYIPKMI